MTAHCVLCHVLSCGTLEQDSEHVCISKYVTWTYCGSLATCNLSDILQSSCLSWYFIPATFSARIMQTSTGRLPQLAKRNLHAVLTSHDNSKII